MADISEMFDQESDCFSAYIDVQQFTPEQLSVKLQEEEHTIIIEGKHSEKKDKHGFISRHFIRRYVVPLECDLRRIRCLLSSDGVLQVSTPKKQQDELGKEVQAIPIVFTGPFRDSLKDKGQIVKKMS